MQKNISPSLIALLGGFVFGVFLSLVGIAILLVQRMGQIQPTLTPIPPLTLIASPTKTPTATMFPTQTLEPTVQDLLSEAERSLEFGEAEKVSMLLYPAIETWTSSTEKAQGYKFLGDAEIALGHPQLAAPYYEKVYFYAPTADNLYILAITYDMGGNLCKALEYYKQLDAWADQEGEFDREFVKSRIEDINCTLGTPSPIQP